MTNMTVNTTFTWPQTDISPCFYQFFNTDYGYTNPHGHNLISVLVLADYDNKSYILFYFTGHAFFTAPGCFVWHITHF